MLMTTYRHISPSIDHNQYILYPGIDQYEYTFQANYESGLRVLRILENSFDLQEVGHSRGIHNAGQTLSQEIDFVTIGP